MLLTSSLNFGGGGDVVQGESIGAMMAAVQSWADVFDMTIHPAVTADEGLRLAQQMMKS